MIPISQIDPELSIYKENTVVIWGAGQYGREILKLLQNFNVEVAYFCDSDIKKWKTEVEGVPVILPQELMRLHIENNTQETGGGGDILVQYALHPVYVAEVKPLVEAMGIEKVICYEEAVQMLNFFETSDFLRESPLLYQERKKIPDYIQVRDMVTLSKGIMLNHKKPVVIICSPPKTGDVTMMKTLSHNNIYNLQTHHPFLLDKDKLNSRIKVIVGTRDPIARLISLFYQDISLTERYNRRFFDDKLTLEKEMDAQVYIDAFLKDFDSLNEWERTPYTLIPNIMEQKDFIFSEIWFRSFAKQVVDFRDYPFDQKKGYTIIETEQYDIFMYQLEKLNDLVPELSDWVGVPFTELVNGNEASTKWIANSYKQAQKELKFSQEYFDMCYNDPYVQHCYSPEDIEKFKDRWRKNIDPNK